MFDGFLRLIASLAEPCRSNVPYCNQCTIRNATERSYEIVEHFLKSTMRRTCDDEEDKENDDDDTDDDGNDDDDDNDNKNDAGDDGD